MSRYSLLLIEWAGDAEDRMIAEITRAVGERLEENVSGIIHVGCQLPDSAAKLAAPDRASPSATTEGAGVGNEPGAGAADPPEVRQRKGRSGFGVTKVDS